jgi:uncharacterized protein
MKKIKAVIGKSLLFVAIFAVAILLSVVPYMKFIDKQLPANISRLLQDTISLFAVLFASWIMTKYFDKRKIVTVGLGNKNILKDIIIGTALALFWVIISFIGLYISGSIERTSFAAALNTSFIFYTLALLLNAAAQELLCRGYLFQTIRNNIGLKAAIIITSLFFLLMHGGALQAGIIASLNVFGAGIIFAIAFYKTGQLWLPIVLHFVWNFMWSSILYKPTSGYEGLQLFQAKGNNLLLSGANGVETSIITTITIIVIILTEQYLLKKRIEN